jgi:Holliday junction resolvase
MERAIVEVLKKFLKDRGIFYIRNIGSNAMRAGLPDFVLCLNGKFIGVECKSGTDDLSAIQGVVRDEIVASGGEYFVVNEGNIDKFKRWVCAECVDKGDEE